MVRQRKGFTLVEVLIVVVIIGIICAISIPKFARSKERTYVTSMKADLRNLATYQESFAADSLGFYFSGDGQAYGFRPSQSVTVTATAINSTPASWSALASHARTIRTCTTVGGITTCT